MRPLVSSALVLMLGLLRRIVSGAEQCDAHAEHENEEGDEADVGDARDHR
jgi:hypothetical protein